MHSYVDEILFLLKVGVTEGEVVTARWHPRHGAGERSWQPGSSCQRDEGEATGSGRREPKGKMYFHKRAINTRACWAGRVGFSPREETGQWEPAGPKVGWAARSAGPKIRKMNF
jgi:hypothetical protein